MPSPCLAHKIQYRNEVMHERGISFQAKFLEQRQVLDNCFTALAKDKLNHSVWQVSHKNMEVVRIGSYPMAGLFYSILYMGCCCINDFVKERKMIIFIVSNMTFQRP